MELLDDDSDRSVTRSLHKRVVKYSAIGIFGVSLTIASVSFWPLYHQQRHQQESWLTDNVENRADATDLYLQNARAIAQQITSRTRIREMLEDYNQGNISREELQAFTADKLLEALHSSEDVLAISRYDAEQQLVVEVGQPPQDSQHILESIPDDIQIDLTALADKTHSRMQVTAPIRNPYSGTVVGTDVVQFKGDTLHQILNDSTGLGKTGEVYLRQVAALPSTARPALSSAQIRAVIQVPLLRWQFWRHPDNKTITAVVPLKTTDFMVMMSMDEREVYGPLYRKLIPILLLILALGTLQTIAVLVLLRPLSGHVLVHSTKLAEINKQLQAACEQSPVSIVITDIRGRIQYVNPKFQELTGYTSAEVIGQTPRILQSGNTPSSTYQELWKTIKSGRTWHGELLNRKKNGESFWESVTISPVKHENGKVTHYVGIKEDITLRRQAQDLLEYQAQHDTLTGLLNRACALKLLSKKLEQAAFAQEQLAVFFIDLNGFKQVNDTLGHAAGDRLLVLMAKRLKNCLRDTDLIARLGGDEFLVAIAGPAIAQQAQALSQKVLETLNQPVSLQETIVQLSGSLGIALYPHHGQNTEDLISQADIAMYTAKQRSAREGVFFNQAAIAAAKVALLSENRD